MMLADALGGVALAVSIGSLFVAGLSLLFSIKRTMAAAESAKASRISAEVAQQSFMDSHAPGLLNISFDERTRFTIASGNTLLKLHPHLIMQTDQIDHWYLFFSCELSFQNRGKEPVYLDWLQLRVTLPNREAIPAESMVFGEGNQLEGTKLCPITIRSGDVRAIRVGWAKHVGAEIGEAFIVGKEWGLQLYSSVDYGPPTEVFGASLQVTEQLKKDFDLPGVSVFRDSKTVTYGVYWGPTRDYVAYYAHNQAGTKYVLRSLDTPISGPSSFSDELDK